MSNVLNEASQHPPERRTWYLFWWEEELVGKGLHDNKRAIERPDWGETIRKTVGKEIILETLNWIYINLDYLLLCERCLSTSPDSNSKTVEAPKAFMVPFNLFVHVTVTFAPNAAQSCTKNHPQPVLAQCISILKHKIKIYCEQPHDFLYLQSKYDS